MADSKSLRSRRSYRHKRGDHSLCRPDRCGEAARVAVIKMPESDASESAGLVETYRARLVEADRLDTPEGQHVMQLATTLATPGHTAAGLAALSKELRAALAEALKDAPRAADRLDELAERRRRKVGS